MISFFRKGPDFLVWAAEDTTALREGLLQLVDGDILTLEEAFDASDEGYTIVMMTRQMSQKITSSDMEQVAGFRCSSEDLLCLYISAQDYHIKSKVRRAPSIVIMRVFGDARKVMDKIGEDYEAMTGSFEEQLEQANDYGIILAFTKESLKNSITVKSLHPEVMYINMRYEDFMADMRMQVLRYINEGIDKRDWYELEIRIYDRYEAYTLQYERLINIIEELEIGLVLGEAWSKDYPRLFMSVGVYRLKLFTFFDPVDVKKVLLGFEYAFSGQRIVDIDVYKGKTKLNWTDTIEKGVPRDRMQMAAAFRKKYDKQLRPEIRKEISELEKQILATRTD